MLESHRLYIQSMDCTYKTINTCRFYDGTHYSYSQCIYITNTVQNKTPISDIQQISGEVVVNKIVNNTSIA